MMAAAIRSAVLVVLVSRGVTLEARSAREWCGECGRLYDCSACLIKLYRTIERSDAQFSPARRFRCWFETRERAQLRFLTTLLYCMFVKLMLCCTQQLQAFFSIRVCQRAFVPGWPHCAVLDSSQGLNRHQEIVLFCSSHLSRVQSPPVSQTSETADHCCTVEFNSFPAVLQHLVLSHSRTVVCLLYRPSTTPSCRGSRQMQLMQLMQLMQSCSQQASRYCSQAACNLQGVSM